MNGPPPLRSPLGRLAGASRTEAELDAGRRVAMAEGWHITDPHFAAFPERLVEPCILAGCPEGGIVMDPFFGSGTVGVVARRLRRRYLGIEINPAYIAIAERRLGQAESDQVGKFGPPLEGMLA